MASWLWSRSFYYEVYACYDPLNGGKQKLDEYGVRNKCITLTSILRVPVKFPSTGLEWMLKARDLLQASRSTSLAHNHTNLGLFSPTLMIRVRSSLVSESPSPQRSEHVQMLSRKVGRPPSKRFTNKQKRRRSSLV